MTTEYETSPHLEAAFDAARRAGGGSAIDGFVERMAERVGGKASVRAVFGDPIERDGITVIPVARVRWAARHEQVVHLDDIMLRRTRLGLVMARGAREVLPKLEPVCREELKWSEQRWREEEQRYLQIWERDHAPVPAG